MKLLSQNKKGFSLIELMIVVAIIGILAALGIPQYTKFQAKARTAEAKGHLTAIFSAETAFQSEWGGYSADLLDLGVAAVGTNLRYTAGFNAVCTTSAGGGAPAEAVANAQIHLATVTAAGATWNTTVLGAAAVTLNDSPACNQTTFKASAGGDPRNAPVAFSAASDTWTIDQAKLISNPITGL